MGERYECMVMEREGADAKKYIEKCMAVMVITV